MVFKTLRPDISSDSLSSSEQILDYIEDIKRETEAKLTLTELTLEKIKEQLSSVKEAIS